MRTVFVYNLSLKAREKDIFEFFSDGGCDVSDVRLIMDRHTRKSKGIAYVEISEKNQLAAAIGLSGGKLFDQDVMIKSSEAEKNAVWEAQKVADSNGNLGSMSLQTQAVLPGMPGVTGMPPVPPLGVPGKLIIKNVHPELKEAELRPVFEPFGVIESIEVQVPSEDKSSSIVNLTYESGLSAISALQQLNGLDLAGKKLEVSAANTPVSGPIQIPPVKIGVSAPVSGIQSGTGIVQPLPIPTIGTLPPPPAPSLQFPPPSITTGTGVLQPQTTPFASTVPVQAPMSTLPPPPSTQPNFGAPPLGPGQPQPINVADMPTNAVGELDDEGTNMSL